MSGSERGKSVWEGLKRNREGEEGKNNKGGGEGIGESKGNRGRRI